MKAHLRKHWKAYLVTAAATAVTGAALYYGVPPDTTQAALERLWSVFGR